MSKMIEELQEGISRLSAENARLKELNREMVEALEEVSKEYLEDKVYHSISYDTYMQVSIAITKAGQVLTKAEGEVPPGIVVGYNFKKMKEGKGE